MREGASIERKLDEDWRMICPEHHHGLQRQAGPTVYCERCNHAYRYEDLIDTRETHRRTVERQQVQ